MAFLRSGILKCQTKKNELNIIGPSLFCLRRGRGAIAPEDLVSSEEETALSSVEESEMRERKR
ncbi:hypothetical protein PRIPAC_95354 [Pristionchus pacificus]|uniref:Uncharacterized protein n=1 Tax=Pristionchus pacificus TaxID=54126 RepID=A0A2A6CUI2_PRIPA|nr:hypothetical protein PRIPAC_95354 [Pristionchus pacificus]|eukprot:PDM81707.1 hypothetical protein PRIPAC_30688 [Pristionchus pacificus]